MAPGKEASYTIKFSPEAKSNYIYDLMVLVDSEILFVPIQAASCRSMLDFGQVQFKHTTEKPVMILDIGEKTPKK